MPYNTGNPIPSSDAKDLSDNAENLDNSVNTALDTWTDRLGVERRTIQGQLKLLGYTTPDVYTGGLVFTVADNTKTIERNKVIYAPLPSAIPFTTSGTWTADDENKFFVAQGLTTENLNEALEESDVIVLAANTVADMKTKDLQSGQFIRTKGYYTEAGKGGALYIIQTAAEFGGTPNGFGDHLLTNGNIAVLQYAGEIDALTFGAVGDGPNAPTAGIGTNNQAALEAAWNYCVDNRVSLYIPAGSYRCVGRVRWGEIVATNTLRDLNGITLRGDGQATLVWTDFGTGADAFNFNNCKNVTVKDIAAGGVLTDFSGAGSNGFSVTNGWDNLQFINIYPIDMPYVDTGGGFDGGQGFTIQPTAVSPTNLGSCQVRGLYAKGCTKGIGYDVNLLDLIGKKPAIHVQGVVEDCLYGVVVSAGAATGALPEGLTCGMTVDAKVINCQQGAIAGRGHGVKWNVDFISTKSIADKQLNPGGTQWVTGLTDVLGVALAYAKNSTIKCTGDMGDVDKKYRIGFGSPGLSGLTGYTEYCDLYFDTSGTSVVEDIEGISEGLFNSMLRITRVTASNFPVGFSDPGNKNILNLLGNTTECAGDWTPILADTNLTDEGATYSTQYATFEAQGNTCFFSMIVALTSLGTLTSSDPASIVGLPIPSSIASGNISACTVGFASNLNLSSPGTVGARIGSNSSHITLSKWDASSTAGHTNLTIGEISSDGLLVISGSYRVA